MNWKKWLSGLVVAGCLLVGGSVAPLWASEADMIDLLLKKNVITQEEADRMTEKIKSSAQQEKAEIKKELTEDIKKDAAKGEFIPSALKGFKFGTTIYQKPLQNTPRLAARDECMPYQGGYKGERSIPIIHIVPCDFLQGTAQL
jgi:polyhydroxyalkanoate synthesis regulator phasin